jgi:xylulokinase
MTWAIGVDVGTTNVKAALVAADGTLVASAQRPLETRREGRGDATVAEQDADAMWAQLVDAVRELTAAEPEAAAGVVALGICSQYSSVVPVDAATRPLAPMLMWQDRRGTERCFEILSRDDRAFATWVERHGIPPVGGGLSLGHILHLQHDQPELHDRTAAYLEAMDYLTARCTGRITASQHSTYMFQLCDNRKLGATSYDDELVELAGVDAMRLPPLVSVDAPVGRLLPDIARALGLPESVTVYAGTNDTATVAVATGTSASGRAGLAIGTTSVLVDAIADYRVDLEHQLFSMPGPFVDEYVVCAENGLGGQVLEHVLGRIVYARDELGDHSVDDAFAALDATLAATAPGAGGVLFLPWLNGSLAPGGASEIRGGFVHMSLETTRRDLLRAVVEGIAHNLGWLLPHVEAFTGTTVRDLAFVGGAARSRQWCRALADVIGRPVEAISTPDRAVARATALLALHRHGVIDRAALDASARGTDRYEPVTAHHEWYAARQAQFEAAHAALLPISEALR